MAIETSNVSEVAYTVRLLQLVVRLQRNYVYVITPFGVVLPIYPPDPEGACARGGRADKPQHHDKRCYKMFITVDWCVGMARPIVCPNKAVRVNLRITHVPFYLTRLAHSQETRSTLQIEGANGRGFPFGSRGLGF